MQFDRLEPGELITLLMAAIAGGRDRRHIATIAAGQAHYRARRRVNAKRAR